MGLSPQYIAGFLDGEGCFSLTWRGGNGQRRRLQAVIVVGSTNREVLEKIRETLHVGSIYEKRRKTKGGRTFYTLFISGNDALRQIIPIFLPYMVVKKHQAELLLEYVSIHKNGSRWKPVEYSKRELEIYEELRKLNSKMARRMKPSSSYNKPIILRRHWKDIDEEKVIEFYKSGLSTYRIAKLFNVSAETIRHILIKNNIERRHNILICRKPST
jgi:intein-encoded DNA endonuclease-like protein